MNIQLISEPIKGINTISQILLNRGVNEIAEYIRLSDKNINDYAGFGIEELKSAAAKITIAIQNNYKTLVVVDSDCDGYTSAALFINYFYKIAPTWIENSVNWSLHEGKQHGLNDQMERIMEEGYRLVICPDSASNDYECHKILKNAEIPLIILDHHLADYKTKDAIIINNQMSDYPNKELSGVGVVWQFCRYMDSLLDTKYADDFLDLVAVGLVGDMMSLRSKETRYLIFKGLNKENIENPFIEYIIDKNSFPLTKADYVSNYEYQACTGMGAAFFIVPFINAINRSGTQEEKELIFNSMLNHKAFTNIPEVKRNKLTGKEEKLVLQAMRVITNVKNRQTRAEEAGLAHLEQMIKDNNMLEHKILLFLLEKDEVDAEIRGLVANKFMAKYQRPCAILTHRNDLYEGSMRGYTKNGLESFKELIESCPGVVYCQGHENAAGLGINAIDASDFLSAADKLMECCSAEPIYRVDYYFKSAEDVNENVILDIADMNDYWGQDIDRAYIGVKVKVTADNFTVMKGNTLKITFPNFSMIKFGGTEEEINKLTTDGWIEIEAYCKCNKNCWNGNEYAQLIIEEFDIIDSCKYIF